MGPLAPERARRRRAAAEAAACSTGVWAWKWWRFARLERMGLLQGKICKNM